MADETTNCSNMEQFVVCIFWKVDSYFGDVKCIDAEVLSTELKDVLSYVKLSLILKLKRSFK